MTQTHRGDLGLQELRRQERVIAEDWKNGGSCQDGVVELKGLRGSSVRDLPRVSSLTSVVLTRGMAQSDLAGK